MAEKKFTFEEFNKRFWTAYYAEQRRIIKEMEATDNVASGPSVKKERARLREI